MFNIVESFIGKKLLFASIYRTIHHFIHLIERRYTTWAFPWKRDWPSESTIYNYCLRGWFWILYSGTMLKCILSLTNAYLAVVRRICGVRVKNRNGTPSADVQKKHVIFVTDTMTRINQIAFGEIVTFLDLLGEIAIGEIVTLSWDVWVCPVRSTLLAKDSIW